MAKILADAEALCRAVAARDLEGVPLYLLRQSILPAECGSGDGCYGYTLASLDLYLCDHIPGYRGRGPCIVINDRALAEDFNGEDLTYRTQAIALHEFGHVLDRPAVYEDRPGVDSNKLKFEALIVAHVTAKPPREDILPYHGHEAGFIRVCLHLCHRAKLVGFDISPGAICAGYTYCLSVAQRYQTALGDEPARCMGMLFRDILATKPPAAFTELWTNDFFQYQQLSQPRKGK
ncbi:MAG: hypothetical protein J5I93_05740 [Pirellulaceae bacterium]|nr:hypothetical protein [Pirellulaceae bacterium]